MCIFKTGINSERPTPTLETKRYDTKREKERLPPITSLVRGVGNFQETYSHRTTSILILLSSRNELKRGGGRGGEGGRKEEGLTSDVSTSNEGRNFPGFRVSLGGRITKIETIRHDLFELLVDLRFVPSIISNSLATEQLERGGERGRGEGLTGFVGSFGPFRVRIQRLHHTMIPQNKSARFFYINSRKKLDKRR